MTDGRRPRTLIAFDVAGNGCSVALWREGTLAARRDEAMRRGQAERLMPMIEAVMEQAGVSWSAIEAIAVTNGPGGFTGVRIGLATARGLALALDRPIIAITNFLAVAAATARSERDGRTLVVALDSKRAEIYAQSFSEDLAPRGEAAMLPPEELDAWLPPGALLLAGDAAARIAPALARAGRDAAMSEAPGRADAAVVARLAAEAPRPRQGAPSPRPLYMRAPDVTFPGASNGEGQEE